MDAKSPRNARPQTPSHATQFNPVQPKPRRKNPPKRTDFPSPLRQHLSRAIQILCRHLDRVFSSSPVFSVQRVAREREDGAFVGVCERGREDGVFELFAGGELGMLV